MLDCSGGGAHAPILACGPARSLYPVIRRALLLLAGLLTILGAAATPASATPRPSAASEGSPVILIGTGGITWTDVSATNTPALWSFLRDGSSAALSVRSVNTNTCPIDGWLSLSAGQRAAAPGPDGSPERSKTDPCPPVPEVESGVVPGWNAYVRAAAAKKFDSRLGLLGEHLATEGTCVQAVGPGGGVGAALTSGAVPRYAALSPEALTPALSSCPVTLVDVGSVRDPEEVAEGEKAPAGSRAEQVRAIDARIQQVVEAAPDGADLVVASLSDAGVQERLRLVAAKGPRYGSGTLASPSTRQPGLVQASDLTVTLIAAAGADVPGELGGAALRRVPADSNSEDAARDRLRDLVDYDQASHEVHSLVPPFFNGVVYTQLAIYALVLLVWKRDFGSPETRTRLLRLVRQVGVVAAAVPAATFLANLVPWWRFPLPMLAVVASVALFVAAISAVALLGPWGRTLLGPMAVVSAATMAVLALDVMTGSRLQLSSLMGLQPVVGGRYYGMGNTTFALFATATILLCIAVSDRFVRDGQNMRAAVAVAAIGLGAVVVDGAPFWGADGGGPPAMLPGLAFLVLSILGVQDDVEAGRPHRGRHRRTLPARGVPRLAAAHRGPLAPRPLLPDDDPGRRPRHHRPQGPAEPLDPLRQLPAGAARADRAGLRDLRAGPAHVVGLARSAAVLRPGADPAARAHRPAHHADDRLRDQRLGGRRAGQRRTDRGAADHHRQRRDPAGRGAGERREPSSQTTVRHTHTSSAAYGATSLRKPSVKSSTAGVIATTRPGT